MVSICHQPIPKHGFHQHSEYVVNLDNVLVERVPYIDTGTTTLTSLVGLLSDNRTQRTPSLEEPTLISDDFVDAEI
jgi:hypothetical protein